MVAPFRHYSPSRQVVCMDERRVLIWMDNARADAMKRIAQKCENDLGIKVSIATPQNITTDFPLAAGAGKAQIL